MIPYFELSIIKLVFLEIKVWGLLVALSFLIPLYFVLKKSPEKGFRKEDILNLSIWIIILSIIGGRIFYFITEDISSFYKDPIEILKIWQGGMSIFGGFIGSLAAILIFTKKYKWDLLKLLDLLAFYLPLGLFIGRLGCFFIHDHRGILTNSIFGVKFSTGTAFDLGLMLSLNGFLIFILFILIKIVLKPQMKGFFIYLLLIFYGTSRFLLDFLREWNTYTADARFYNLTIAQYLSLFLLGIGLYFLITNKLFEKK